MDERYLARFAEPLPPVPPDHFRCDKCGGVFPKEWSEEVAVAEMESYFGPVAPEDRAVVCDDCWAKIHPARN